MHSVSNHMRLTKPMMKMWMMIDPYCQRRWCNPVTRVWQCKAHGNVCACSLRQFSVISLAISSETLEMRSSLLYTGVKSIGGFSVISKCVILNDLGWLFYFQVFWLLTVWLSKIFVWKLIKIDTYYQQYKSLAGSLVSGSTNLSLCGYSHRLSRKEASKHSGVAYWHSSRTPFLRFWKQLHTIKYR